MRAGLVRVYKRGGLWRVESSGVEWPHMTAPTWREAFDTAFDVATSARRLLGLIP